MGQGDYFVTVCNREAFEHSADIKLPDDALVAVFQRRAWKLL